MTSVAPLAPNLHERDAGRSGTPPRDRSATYRPYLGQLRARIDDLFTNCNRRHLPARRKAWSKLPLALHAAYSVCEDRGWVAERLKAPVLKTGGRETVSWVRIPPHPPLSRSKQLKSIAFSAGGPLSPLWDGAVLVCTPASAAVSIPQFRAPLRWRHTPLACFRRKTPSSGCSDPAGDRRDKEGLQGLRRCLSGRAVPMSCSSALSGFDPC